MKRQHLDFEVYNGFKRTDLESRIKYTILALTLFASFVFIMWAFTTLAYMVSMMDIFATLHD